MVWLWNPGLILLKKKTTTTIYNKYHTQKNMSFQECCRNGKGENEKEIIPKLQYRNQSTKPYSEEKKL